MLNPMFRKSVKKEWGISSIAFVRKLLNHLRDKRNNVLKRIVCLVRKGNPEGILCDEM
jgi:hypothetical protein